MKKMLFTLALTSMVLLWSGMAGAQSSYFQAVMNLSPTGYWPMHETTAPVQGSIEANQGTLGALGTAYYADWVYNTNVYRQVPGLLASDSDPAAGFRGGNPSWMVVPHTSPMTTLKPPFTIECWAKGTNNVFGDIVAQGGATLNGNGTNANKNGVRLCWGGNNSPAPNFQVYVGNGTGQSSLSTGPNYAIGQTYHLVLTCDANTNFSLHVNGDSANALTNVSTTLAMLPCSWNPLTIGAGFWTKAGCNRHFNGTVDEVAVYTNVLPNADIAAHYTAGTTGAQGDYPTAVQASNPLLYYRMNSPAYTAADVSTWPVLTNYGSAAINGVYMPGTVPGSVAGPDNRAGGPAAGIENSSFAGNGVGSYAVAGYDTAFDPTGTTPLTIAAWFKGNPTDPRYQNIVGHSDSSWRLATDWPGKIHFNAGAGGEITSVGVYNDSRWHHAVAVYDGSTNYLYVDGLFDSASAAPNTITGSTLPVLIGSDPQYTNNPAGIGRQFAGNICEVAFWNGTALSASQVQALYSAAGIAPAIKTQPTSGTVNQNSSYTNSLAATGSDPMSYQWYQNNSPRPDQTSAMLRLTSAQPSDSSTNWYVVVTNAYGSVTSSVVSLTVNVLTPTITLSGNSTQITMSYTGTLQFSTNVAGGYQPVSGATSPYSVAPGGPQMFYRSSNP